MIPKVVGVGELLWDLLPSGRQLGGAPANFAFHAHALGAEAYLVARVGDDVLGREAIGRLCELGMPASCIEVDTSLPTGTVSVAVAADGQPQFEIHENVAWDALSGEAAGRTAVASADAVCFGTLAQRSERSRSTIRSLVAGAPGQSLRILDVNLRQHYFSAALLEESLSLASVLKLNDAELVTLAGPLDLTGDSRSQIVQLAERYELRLVACTRGECGSLLFSEGSWSEVAGKKIQVVDTVGAGDAFAAAMTLGLLAGWPLDIINQRANEVAAHVASCAGGTPALPECLCEPFRSSGAGTASRAGA